MFHKITSEISPQKLFLIDGLGALLTAFLLAVVLPNFKVLFGMPEKVLHGLALVACSYAIYSLWNCLRKHENWRPFLKVIAIANLIYCILTIGLVIYFWQALTGLGIAYFLFEILIIISLAVMELKVGSKKLET